MEFDHADLHHPKESQKVIDPSRVVWPPAFTTRSRWIAAAVDLAESTW
jgi:hypothetical protein